MPETTGASPIPHSAFRIPDLRSLLEAAFGAAGTSPEEAAVITDSLIEAERAGVPTHGVMRASWYLPGLKSGRYNPRANVRPVHDGPAAVLFEAEEALGFLPGARAADAALERARRLGLGAAGVRNANEAGRMAYYAERIAGEGFVGVACSNSVPQVAPPGATTATHGNNPFAYAFPGEDGPVFDACWTPRAGGEVARRRILGLPLPAEWGYTDASGRPTTDPAAAQGQPQQAPGGGKGFGIAVLVDALAGMLTGSLSSTAVPRENRGIGIFVLALDPDLFGAGDRLDGVQQHAAGAVRGAGGRMPGERQRANREQAAERVSIPTPIIETFRGALEGLDPALASQLTKIAVAGV